MELRLNKLEHRCYDCNILFNIKCKLNTHLNTNKHLLRQNLDAERLYTVYKISCIDPELITDCYIGITGNYTKRIKDHKNTCNNSNTKRYNTPVYKFIRSNGGLENFKFSIVSTKLIKILDKLQQQELEAEMITYHKANLNVCIPGRSKEQWFIVNKDRITKKFNCICGGKYTTPHELRHHKTKKHTKYILNNYDLNII